MPHESLIAEYKIAFAAAAVALHLFGTNQRKDLSQVAKTRPAESKWHSGTLRLVPVLSSQKLKGHSSEVDLEERRHD